jgi:hypothetical protein
LSVRAALVPSQILTVGAVISGGGKNILVRAAGPALSKFGLPGAVDPQLEIYQGSSRVASTDDWSGTVGSVFASVGAFAFDVNSKDAATSQVLSENFTVQTRASGAGTVLVEAYDVGGGSSPRFVNLSTRNRVGTGDNLLIVGFNINGTGTKRVLIRAVGPSLRNFGVTDVLADPKLQVFANNGSSIAENDDWASTLASTFTQVAAFQLAAGGKDAALLLSLNAGATYTVQVSGADGGTGEALVEVYEVF